MPRAGREREQPAHQAVQVASEDAGEAALAPVDEHGAGQRAALAHLPSTHSMRTSRFTLPVPASLDEDSQGGVGKRRATLGSTLGLRMGASKAPHLGALGHFVQQHERALGALLVGDAAGSGARSTATA